MIAVLLMYTEFSPAFTIHNDDSSDPTRAVDDDSFDQFTNFESWSDSEESLPYKCWPTIT